MNPHERISNWKVHDSMRGAFGHSLYKAMAEDERIWLITADLGYGLFDNHKQDFGERFVNVGAAEQLALGTAVGLALSGKIPFVYSITPFLICRGYEWLKNYLEEEQIPVRLIGSGLDDDYKHDGISHHAFDAKQILSIVPNIHCYWPEHKESIPEIVRSMIDFNEPSFVALRR